MIKSLEQIESRTRWAEYDRRKNASETQVESLTTVEIREALKRYFTKEELRAELKRRNERLRYAKIMANPRTRSLYRARKRAEYARTVSNYVW